MSAADVERHLCGDTVFSRDRMVAVFEQRVAATPDHPAVLDRRGTITYRDLAASADAIASFLASSAVDTVRPVGIMVRNSAQSLAAIIGAAKAGRIAMPLELDLPEARLSLILVKSGAQMLLAGKTSLWLAKRAAPSSCRVVSIREALAHPTMARIRAERRAEDSPALILYTSGSTGTPKGVVHGVNYLPHFASVWSATIALQARDRVCILYPHGVSSGLNRSLAALLSGATLCPFGASERGLNRLADWIVSRRVSVLVMATALFRAWLSTLPDARRFPRLRVIEVATEPLTVLDVLDGARHLEKAWKIVNIYGASEVGMIASAAFGPDNMPDREILPVGFSPPGQELSILKEDGTLATPGTSGEIVVKSPSVALGYWQDTAASDAAFLTDPADGARLYRSGDLGRLNRRGQLEHLGRKDRKIKLRGYSVELHDVECALIRLPGVRDAVALVDQDGNEKRLIGYVAIPDERMREPDNALRARLAAQLPSYMVPSAIVVVDAMPLTERGKIDRKALPRPKTPNLARNGELRPPADRFEHALLAIWQQALNLDELGIDDDFHELGGSSLQAITVLAKIAKKFGRDLPPSVMLIAPTIAKQAAILRNEMPVPDWSVPTPLRGGNLRAPLFIVHAAFGSILFAHDLAQHLKTDRPVFGIQAPPLDRMLNRRPTIEGIAADYLAEIKSVQPRGPYYVAGYSFGAWVAFEIAQQLKRQRETIAFLGLIDPIRNEPWKETFSIRTGRHLAELRKQSVRGKFAYLERKMRWKLGYEFAHLKLALARRFACFSARPAHRYRRTLYAEIFPRATRRYEPKPYAGDAAIFSSDGLKEAQETYWRSFVEGELSVIEIPAEHLELIRPPHNAILAQHLDACLERAIV